MTAIEDSVNDQTYTTIFICIFFPEDFRRYGRGTFVIVFI